MVGSERRPTCRPNLKYGYGAGLLYRQVRYGPTFKKPSKKVLRIHRAKNGKRMMGPDELRRIIDAASVQMKAMVLLSLNCAFGNDDCAPLPLGVIDAKRGWIDFPRPKTGVARRCPLWGEMIAAIEAAIADRPTPKNPENAGLLFVTKYGRHQLVVLAAERHGVGSVPSGFWLCGIERRQAHLAIRAFVDGAVLDKLPDQQPGRQVSRCANLVSGPDPGAERSAELAQEPS